MNESFLHYLWQFQYFDKRSLVTAAGEEVNIVHTGNHNTDSGPDFSSARIKIGTMEWNGSVEIHIRSSEWLTHHHQNDRAYENVILHVVWSHDKAIVRNDGTEIPTLELKDRVDPELLQRYTKLVSSGFSIPCKSSFHTVPEIVRMDALEKALVQRLETKSQSVRQLLHETHDDWEETAYQVLARNFGFKINSDPFLRLAQSTPYKIIRKHTNQLHQLEALLFGQAGMLVAKSKDEYITQLYTEYEFLKHKYDLQQSVTLSEWKFLRLRPANFPTLRIAQFAKLLTSTSGIFSKLVAATDFQELANLFSLQPSEYWTTHYRFGKQASAAVSPLGESSFHNLIINSVVPLLAAYGKVRDEDQYVERAMEMLQHIPPEQNRITKIWSELGQSPKSSFDSQALIELYNNFCGKRHCLNCAIGSSLLKPSEIR